MKSNHSEEPTTKPQLVIKEQLTKNTFDNESNPKTDKSKKECMYSDK